VRTTLVLVGIVAAVFLVPVIIGLSRDNALGYDEALYAQATRRWATLGASSVSGWGIHRPPALPVIGVPLYLAGSGEEWTLRLSGVVSGLVIVAAAWRGGTILAGSVAGIIAALATAAASPIQVEATSYLTDLPSTAVLLVLAVLCLEVLWSPPPRRRDFVLMAVLAVLAFYIRYGAALDVIALVAAAAATRPRAIVSREAAFGAAVGAVLLLPHLIGAGTATGSPYGILDAARRAATGDGGVPLGDYVRWLPFDLVGPVGAGLALLAAAMAVRFVARPRDIDEPFRSRGLFLAGAAGLSLLLIGLSVHAEPRYVLFPLVMLIVLGSGGLGRVVTGPTRRTWAVPLVAVVLTVAALVGLQRTMAVVGDRSARWDWLRTAGRDIAVDARGGTCSVLTSDVPIIAWYSGCAGVNYLTGDEPDRLSLLTGSRRYIVERSDGHLQPDDSAMRGLTSDATPWRSYRDGFGEEVARVFRLAP